MKQRLSKETRFFREQVNSILRDSNTWHRDERLCWLVTTNNAVPVLEGETTKRYILPNGDTVCRKITYWSREQACAALIECQEVAAQWRREKSFYLCPDCGGWHLSSRENKKPA